jgi:hypothetical protein
MVFVGTDPLNLAANILLARQSAGNIARVSRFVGNPYLGITSCLPVTWRRGDLGYCRGFAVFGACAARLYSASVSAITSVRPPSPGCSMMLITS